MSVKSVIFGISILLYSCFVNASNCTNLARQIYSDIEQFNSVIRTQSFAWKNSNWIINYLGPGEVQKTVESTLRWNTFMIQTRNDEMVTYGGTFSAHNLPAKPSLKQILEIMGQPKQIITRVKAQHSWKCPENASSISIIANENDQVVQINVTNCVSPLGSLAPSSGCVTTGAILLP